MHRMRTEAGAVTAEAAVVLPLLVLFTVGLVWLVAVGATEVRALDAARETARAAARGEAPEASVGLGRRVATADAEIEVLDEGETILVTVDAPVRGPGGIFAFVPTYHVRARAVAAQEPGP
ncbi:TadE family type IV pilus minor pilin [Nocardioides pocheonensis]|uniref:Pilus assembly protein n=1 Tax=Nocardioides pocheonensis TaxID=661485 RepID=A0A3N0GRF4_9ACTN|nr:TadE family type IV pilus minor pilin [Nocardioides pocheonensis]RNM14680.1 pilus assembly protein [Nocardioides pocheonensis]